VLIPRSISAWLCLALAMVVPASQRRVLASRSEPTTAASRSDALWFDSHPPAPSVFRLGDAARPFGWSTVIGDFNTDGKPDVAVADHVARRASSYAYRLEFSVSGQATRHVTFESRHDAVTVRVADVDRDNDLDVIVGTPLSAETVGIWLNDGQGHFTASDAGQVPATVRSVQSLSTTDAVASFAFEPSPRRGDEALPAVFGATLARSADRSTRPRSHTIRSLCLSTRSNPRAPPSAVLDALS
jgi:hypothetical protein